MDQSDTKMSPLTTWPAPGSNPVRVPAPPPGKPPAKDGGKGGAVCRSGAEVCSHGPKEGAGAKFIKIEGEFAGDRTNKISHGGEFQGIQIG